MIDLNNEQIQSENTGRPPLPIPNNSMVLVELTLREPKYKSSIDEMVTRTKNGLLGLDCEFEVMAGVYKGAKLWETIWLPTGMQAIQLSEGQQTACRIAGSKLKAIVEAARNINPDDNSITANKSRMLQGWLSLSGLRFGVRVGVRSEPNDKGYYNNFIRNVITPELEEYNYMMTGGECITDEPAPKNEQRQGQAGRQNQQSRQASSQSYKGTYATPDEDIPF